MSFLQQYIEHLQKKEAQSLPAAPSKSVKPVQPLYTYEIIELWETELQILSDQKVKEMARLKVKQLPDSEKRWRKQLVEYLDGEIIHFKIKIDAAKLSMRIKRTMEVDDAEQAD